MTNIRPLSPIGRIGPTLCFVALLAGVAPGDENPKTVEAIAKSSRDSVVVITFRGRNGQQQGLGTGFVISADGLIATNHHVIGEARGLNVQLADGRTCDVEAVHASDRDLDLAILRVSAKDLPALPLRDTSDLKDGESVVVLGNPLGLKYSVVSGVVSGRRDVDNRPMIQLAIPIEPGNSGGPVLDLNGQVIGIVTMKSVITNNLGFAVDIRLLKPLIEKPNPIPMSRWLTIGALDSKEWTVVYPARWHQRGGKILVAGGGDSMGRTLCLSEEPNPEVPFELATDVKLNDESGAAGLVFNADGSDKHYGFYPSNGNLRFSRFDGPTVQTWNVLREIPAVNYRPGEWNNLKVRVEADKFLCYVNDRQVMEITDRVYASGKVGLVKFRQTEAEFKRFQVAPSIPSNQLDEALTSRLLQLTDALPSLGTMRITHLAPFQEAAGARGATSLRERAKVLEQRAKELRQVAGDLHLQSVIRQLLEVVGDKDEFDLLRASLLIARLDDEEIDVDHYVRQVNRIADEIRRSTPKDADEATRRAALDKHLFEENGFHGSRFDYYQRANSYMNRVIDDREGLPLTLSILYMELARRLDLRVDGVPLPGHFIVQFVPKEGAPQFLDVFSGAKSVSREEALDRARAATGRDLGDDVLHPATHRQMLLRMLANLRGNAGREEDLEAQLRYLEAMIALDPQSPRERFERAALRFRTGREDEAIADMDWFVDNQPDGVDIHVILQMQEQMRRSRRLP